MAGANTSLGSSDVPGTWRDTIIALVLVGIGFAIRIALFPIVGTDYPYITFFLATVYSAWRCRWQVSVIVTLLGWLIAQWYFVPPLHAFNFASASVWLGTGGFFLSCAAVLTLGERLRRQNLRLRKELSERKQAEEQLLRAAQFPEQNPSPVMRMSLDGTLLYCNPAARSELAEWNLMPGGRVPESVRAWVVEALKTTHLARLEQSVGGRVYGFVAAHFASLGYVNLYGTDVTETRAAEQIQQRTLERYHLLSDVSGRLLASEDPQKIINELCARVMTHLDCDGFLNYMVVPERGQLHLNASSGFSEEDVRRMEWLDIGQALCGAAAQEQTRIVANDLQKSSDPRAALMKELGFRTYACHPLMSAGRTIGTLSFAARHRDRFTDEELDLMQRITDQVAIAIDRIRAAQAVRESEFRFRAMANASPTMIWIADTNKLCVWFNTAWLTFVGRTLEQEQGHGWAENVHPSDFQRCLDTFRRSFDLRETFEMEYRLRRTDGEYRWILDRGTPLYDAFGEFKGYIGSCVDVHDRHVQRDELERAVEERTIQLRESVAELESFSYSIAHDMRAPLRAMHGFGKILMQEAAGQLDEPYREYLRRIIVAAQRLDALIQDVLDYSRIARCDLPLEEIELDSFIRDILVSYPDFAPARARIEVKGTLPAVVANRAALTQVVSNLLGNAVKFVMKDVFPNVEISAVKNSSHVRLSIQDNGIGINNESQGRIFQMFQRLNRADLYEGTGIGLAIVRKAVERMGGSVSVESEPGKGSTFHVELKSSGKQ